MKIKTSTLVSLAALALVVAATLVVNKKGKKIRLTQISDEGYETAHDMLYPDSFKGAKELRYGPVLPN